jgi:hypothetical protein
MIAIWAALAMVCQDILAVCMCQAENRGRGWAAGVLDAASWIAALVTYHYSLNSVNGHNSSLKVAVILAVTAANVIGSKSGQYVGDRFFPDPNILRFHLIEARLANLETKDTEPC